MEDTQEKLGEGLRATTATVMFVDVVESVRHVQRDERGAIARMRDLMALASRIVPQHMGEVVERLGDGDGLVLRFMHARSAVQCAAALHELVRERTAALPAEARIQLRAGIHSASIWADASGLYGLGVNLAARVAAMGGPGDTLLSATARDQLVVGPDGDVTDLGDCYLKHVAQPVRLFRHQPQARPLPGALQQAIAHRLQTRPVLAILPFVAAAASAGNSPPLGLGDVVADQLTAGLSRCAHIHVICALSAGALRARDFERGALYQALGADYLLLGEVRTDSTSQVLELHARLYRRGAGEPVHDTVVSGPAVDLLATHSDLLGGLARDMAARMVQVELRMAGPHAALPNLGTHTLYLNAVALLHRFSSADFERAREMLEALAERAPRHAEPLAWLARWHVFRVVQGWTHDRQRDSQQAMDFSRRALDRDADSSLALTMAGSVHAGIHRDPQAALDCYGQALERNPNEALAWLMKGVSDGFMGHGDDALAASETALGLSPMDPMSFYYSALSASAALGAGAFERAMALAERAIAHSRSHGSAYRTLAIAAHQLGQTERARETVQRLLVVEPQASIKLFHARTSGSNPLHAEFTEALRASGLPQE